MALGEASKEGVVVIGGGERCGVGEFGWWGGGAGLIWRELTCK